jgi:hypothetical protein
MPHHLEGLAGSPGVLVVVFLVACTPADPDPARREAARQRPRV